MKSFRTRIHEYTNKNYPIDLALAFISMDMGALCGEDQKSTFLPS
ncbi:MAG: hypothetical protein AAF849_11730 [Bacteroidota bacterium]